MITDTSIVTNIPMSIATSTTIAQGTTTVIPTTKKWAFTHMPIPIPTVIATTTIIPTITNMITAMNIPTSIATSTTTAQGTTTVIPTTKRWAFIPMRTVIAIVMATISDMVITTVTTMAKAIAIVTVRRVMKTKC
jgi:hypothetical protein